MSPEDTCLDAVASCTTREAYMQGYVSSEQAYSITQNPYPHGVLAHAWWEAGHSQATDDLCGEGR